MSIARLSAMVVGIALSFVFCELASAQLYGDWQFPVSLESIPGTSLELEM